MYILYLKELNLNNIKDIKEEQFVELFDAFKRNENLESFSAVNCDIRFGSSIKFFKFSSLPANRQFLEISRLANFFFQIFLKFLILDSEIAGSTKSISFFFHACDWLKITSCLTHKLPEILYFIVFL